MQPTSAHTAITALLAPVTLSSPDHESSRSALNTRIFYRDCQHLSVSRVLTAMTSLLPTFPGSVLALAR